MYYKYFSALSNTGAIGTAQTKTEIKVDSCKYYSTINDKISFLSKYIFSFAIKFTALYNTYRRYKI